MEAIFEFIFGNLFVLIFVIGGIISFFKRSNQTQQSSSKQAKQEKPFIPQLEDFFEELKNQEDERPKSPVFKAEKPAPKVEIVGETQSNPFYEKLREMDTVSFDSPQRQSKQTPKKTVNANLSRQNINHKKVVEGIIWGEIVGPPRARKKHSYSYLKRG